MEYREIPAPADLSDWVHCIWYLRGGAGGVQPVVPDGRPEIVIHLGEPFAALDVYGRPRRQAEVLVAGQLTRPLRLQPSSEADVIGIRFNSVGAGAFLRVPMTELTDEVAALRDLHPRLGDRLLDSVVDRVSVEQRMQAVVAAIRRVAPARPGTLVRRAVRDIEMTRRLGALADRYRTSRRTLQRRFRDEVGVGPKLFARIVRFRRVYRLIAMEQMAPARAALKCGYYDQAHLIRDFRRFAGQSPGQFFRRATNLSDAFLAAEGELELESVPELSL